MWIDMYNTKINFDTIGVNLYGRKLNRTMAISALWDKMGFSGYYVQSLLLFVWSFCIPDAVYGRPDRNGAHSAQITI